jgi:hypothetical protein
MIKFRWCGTDECYFLLAIQPTTYFKSKLTGQNWAIRPSGMSANECIRVRACLFEFFSYRFDVIFPRWELK